ncbi:cutinase family protein [Parafrankia sp. FMc2]|uniref:cutinase family protein n=1 Tax=Parafrankia sp. FMc2 TaxID=3233196 RepID=UPI0034D40DFB
MRMVRSWKTVAVALAMATSAGTVGIGLTAGPASAAPCSDVDIVFARGTGESPGLGITGTPFVNSLRQNLGGATVSSYAVTYAASTNQTSAGPGATDMTRHVVSVAASCPDTTFVLGGYSQGASVTDISIGIPTVLGSGETIPTALAPRVAAVVVFGNPLALSGQHIPTASPLYGSKAREYCNVGDPVCANGSNFYAHILYGFDGSTTDGAAFAAARVRALG